MNRTSRLTGLNQGIFIPAEGQRKSRRSRKASLSGSGRKQTKAQRGMPPVLVRNEGTAMPAAVSSRGKARRRYDVALSMPGAEVRLPALPQVRLGWRLISAMLSLVLAGALYYAWNMPTFAVETLQVNGIERLAVEELEDVLAISGERVYLLNPGELSQDLLAAFPELSAANIEVGLPAEVKVEVVERQPIMAWNRGEQQVWVDESGYVFPSRGDTSPEAAVTGSLPADTLTEGYQEGRLKLDPTLVQAIVKMSDRVPQDASLVYDQDYGLGWNDWRGWQVYFGMETAEIETKLIVYEALVDSLDNQGIQPVVISMEFVHAPYYRVER